MKCFKCGIEEGQLQKQARGMLLAKLIKHHTGYNPEIIVDCCLSCHKAIHLRLRKKNACSLSVSKINYLSRASSSKRSLKKYRRTIAFSETLMPNVQLLEHIETRITTGTVICTTYFVAGNGKELLYIECD